MCEIQRAFHARPFGLVAGIAFQDSLMIELINLPAGCVVTFFTIIPKMFGINHMGAKGFWLRKRKQVFWLSLFQGGLVGMARATFGGGFRIIPIQVAEKTFGPGMGAFQVIDTVVNIII
jgi:hypothetical protein